MKVALYTRSAVFNPQAVSEQLARLQAHAATNHFEVAGIYEDNGQSVMTLDRTGIQSLLADADAPQVLMRSSLKTWRDSLGTQRTS